MTQLKIHFIIFGSILIIGVGLYLQQNYNWKTEIDSSCTEMEEYKITGHSMDPLLADGNQVKGLVGYYNCNQVQRGEIAILGFKTRKESFVKKIAGIPGDKIEFQDNQLKLNGEIVKNSNGASYLFALDSQRIITASLKDGKISEARYLILSEEIGSSAYDSRQFGLVEKDHLKGRVIQ